MPHLHSFLRQEHLRGRLRFEDDLLIAEVNTHRARLHLSNKTGKTGMEAKFTRNVTVPDANGWRIQLQVMPGDTVGQAVRPQTRTVSYHDHAGNRVSWIENLDALRIKGTAKSLWLNLDYGKQVTAGFLERLKDVVQSEADRAAVPSSRHLRRIPISPYRE